MNNYAITIDTLEKEYDIAIESGDTELANAIKTTLQYIKDVAG